MREREREREKGRGSLLLLSRLSEIFLRAKITRSHKFTVKTESFSPVLVPPLSLSNVYRGGFRGRGKRDKAPGRMERDRLYEVTYFRERSIRCGAMNPAYQRLVIRSECSDAAIVMDDAGSMI